MTEEKKELAGAPENKDKAKKPQGTRHLLAEKMGLAEKPEGAEEPSKPEAYKPDDAAKADDEADESPKPIGEGLTPGKGRKA